MSIMRSAREFFFGPDDEAYYEYDEASDYDRREGYREPGARDDVRDGGTGISRHVAKLLRPAITAMIVSHCVRLAEPVGVSTTAIRLQSLHR